MKKLLLSLCILGTVFSAPANAWVAAGGGYRGGYNGYHGGYNGYRGPVYYNNGYNNNWVAPAIAGAVVGGLVARSYYAPPPVVYAPPPVVYAAPQVTYYQQPAPSNIAPTNPPPYGYHWSYLLDGNCNCYRWVILQDGS